MDLDKSWQPPSCGCVLKHIAKITINKLLKAAAFVRLCVETTNRVDLHGIEDAAAFVRLCVETENVRNVASEPIAAAFVRLCVETGVDGYGYDVIKCSRLRAAVC